MIVQVSDFTDKPIVSSKTLIDAAASRFSADKPVQSDTVAFLDGRRGRNITFKDGDENEASVSIFFVRGHLYAILTLLAPQKPSIQNAAVDEVERFRNSFHFTH